MGISELISLGAIEENDLRQSLDILFSWLDAQNAKRQRQIIEYLIAEERAGRAHLIKAYSLALDVFDKEDDFDASKSSLVRVEMHRLRESLGRFYKSGGRGAPYMLVLKPGQYRLMATLNKHHVPIEDEHSAQPESGACLTAAEAQSTNQAVHVISPLVQVNEPQGKAGKWRGLVRIPKWSPTSIIFIMLLVIGVPGLAYWGYNSSVAGGRAVENFAPTVAITFDEADRGKTDLLAIKQMIEAMHPQRFHVTISRDPGADYTLHLATITDKNGRSGVEASLFDKKRSLVATDNYALENNESSNFNISKIIDNDFLRFASYVPTDYKENILYDSRKREIFKCYYDSNGWVNGLSQTIPDFDEIFDCIDPDRVSDPRDKFLLHVMRSSIIANSASGVIRTNTRFTLEDAKAELDLADKLLPGNKLTLGQRIVLEWRNPDRDVIQLRRLLDQARKGPMGSELRYDVAATYAFYLGDWDMAREISQAGVEVQQGMIPSMGPITHYVELPEPFVKGDYVAARRALDASRAKTNPTYALFALAIGCARNDPKEITAAISDMRAIPTVKPGNLITYAMKRRYAPELEKALLTALTSPQCRNITAAP